MKGYKKKAMLQTIATLAKANEMISRGVIIDSASVLDALTQCQESAILLGTFIDTLDKNYAYLVRILEEYCENAYQMSICLSDKSLLEKMSKTIEEQLTQLMNGIQYDMPDDRNEVVFLPYQASMWDSLESIWKVADADENTDAYVIPIPYFVKNPDKSFREMHYEGDQFPEYVAITKYDTYDFEKHNPDVIFIHNPYDDCNAVTSVHSFFYSKNLKKFTEKLVYIPYFLLAEIDPNDKNAVEAMKHFCTLPGVFNSDKVIVQSQDMRQVYINVLTEVSGNTEEVRKYWEKKIDGLGSPKLDKVINTKKENQIIPDDWKKIIYKPDGTIKSIVFYNNSIVALLQNSQEMITKMKNVFQTFKEHRDEVALLWRPHPLIENTLISMCPDLWNEYKKIRDEYLQEGWGIYDDTPDIDRAVIISDAYYGDQSSVVQLYEKTGKTIMIQNVKVGIEL